MIIQMNHTIKYIYRVRGGCQYMIDEPVTQALHGVQTALRVKELGGDKHMQLTGLIHDIGHILYTPIDPSLGIDDKHEEKAFMWLKHHQFPDKICYPIRNHVNAKRFMCSTEWGYYESLSPASKTSFKLQGGFMSQEEKKLFLQQPYSKETLLLRRADDQAKRIGMTNLPDFGELLDELFTK